MARFNLDEYETVADRIKKFWADCPEGRIYTEVLNDLREVKHSQFVVRAYVYKNGKDTQPWATGLAEEHFLDRGPNETSPLENCETSAIGRALANAGYATSSADRPSREEMEKVERQSSAAPKIAAAKAAVVEGRQNFARNPKGVDVASDPRWGRICEGAAADPSNEFLRDLVEKGRKWGNLTEKQLGAGYNAAAKVTQARPTGEMTVAKINEAFGGTQEEKF